MSMRYTIHTEFLFHLDTYDKHCATILLHLIGFYLSIPDDASNSVRSMLSYCTVLYVSHIIWLPHYCLRSLGWMSTVKS